MEQNEILSHRFSKALGKAEESDFYSRDGVTWDETANDLSFYLVWTRFRRSIIEEMNMMDPSATSLEGLSDEVLAFLDRVESRGAENA